VDATGVVRAMHRPAREYLGVQDDPRGRELKEVLCPDVLDRVGGAALRITSDDATRFEEVELPVGEGVRLRLAVHELVGPEGRRLGRVILAREISHEPMRRRFDAIVESIARAEGSLRDPLRRAQEELHALMREVKGSSVASPGMSELAERTSRTLTAVQYWLAVDDAMATEDYPDAQPLLDRMRLATARWPLPEHLPQRVHELAQRVESYYESGENPKQRVL
jgi:hypothetical protein